MVRAERIVRGYNQRDAGIDARQFLDDDGIFDITEPGPAEVFRKYGAHHSEFAGFLDYIQRKDLILIPLQNVRRNFGQREFMNCFAKLYLLRRVFEVHMMSPTQAKFSDQEATRR